MDNYEVQPDHQLFLGGRFWRSPAVLPDWFLDRDGGLAARVAEGAVKKTGKPCTVDLGGPQPKTQEDPIPALEIELERLRKENVEFAQNNRELAGRDGAREAELRRLTNSLGKATAEIAAKDEQLANVQELLGESQAKVSEFESLLEKITEPVEA